MSYLIQSSLFLLIFYVFYYWLLKDDKLMNFQRAYLLAALILSLTIPLIEIDLQVAPDLNAQLNTIIIPANLDATQTVSGETNDSLTFYDILGYVYWLGVILMSIRLVFSIRKITLTLRSSTVEYKKNYKLVYTGQPIPVSSFLNYIFLSKTHEYSEKELSSILAHERKHITDWHSFDIIGIEILKIIYWFNPAVYLFDHALRAIHEYVSDQEASKTHGVSDYEQLLITTLFKKANLPLFSQFGEVSIKKRIHMLNQENPKTMNKLKYLILIPITFALIWACNPSEFESVESNEMIPISGKIISVNGNPLPGVNVVVQGSTIGTVTDIEGNYSLKIPGGSKLTASFIGFNSETVDVGSRQIVDFELTTDDSYEVSSLLPKKNLIINTSIIEENGKKYVTGKIKDEEYKALSNIKVALMESKAGVVTDENGEFKLEIIDEKDKVIFYHEGYKLEIRSLANC